jgi:hypothetical protein
MEIGHSGNHPWMDDPSGQVPLSHPFSKNTAFGGHRRIKFGHRDIQAKPFIAQGGYYGHRLDKDRGTIPWSLVDDIFSRDR